MAVTNSNVPGMNPSTVDFRLATVTVARGSTTEHQEIIVIGDPESSVVGPAKVMASAPTSTTPGLVVRVASGPSTAADLSVAITNPSASDNDTGVMAGGKSSVTVVMSESFGWDGSTNWTKVQASTSAPAVGANAWAVRPVRPTLASTASLDAFAASTSWTVAASNATTKAKVYAYSITTTCVTATRLAFYSGSSMKWPIVLQAISSAISGANLAVNPPNFLFQGAASSPLTLQSGGSSAGPAFLVGVSYFSET